MPKAQHTHEAPYQINGKGQQGVGKVLAQQGDKVARHMQGIARRQQAAHDHQGTERGCDDQKVACGRVEQPFAFKDMAGHLCLHRAALLREQTARAFLDEQDKADQNDDF